MKLAILLCIAACASAIDPATLLLAAAKAKAAGEIADGVGQIFKNIGDKVSNEGEDIADKTAQTSTNNGILLDILQQINNGQLHVSKRAIIPERDVLLERIASLYDRVRAYVNGGAEAGVAAYEEALNELKTTYERLQSFTSLDWIKRWLEAGLNKIEDKLDEYERNRKISRRDVEVIPPSDVILQKIGELYDRLRELVNGGANQGLDTIRNMLDQARDSFERIDQFRHLDWLKRWIVDVLNKIDEKISELEPKKEAKREIVPSKEELLARVGNLYERFRSFVNEHAAPYEEKYAEGLLYIHSLIDRISDHATVDYLKKLIIKLIDRAEQELDKLENRLSKREIEILPPKDEVIAKIYALYDRIRAYVNDKENSLLSMYKGALDEVRDVYEKIEDIRSLRWLKSWAISAINALEQKLDEFEESMAKDKADEFHALYRRDLNNALEEHFDSRTARGLGDTISTFFKEKFQQINQTFVGFGQDVKGSWSELMEEVKPIIAQVENRGNQLLDDTREAAQLIRKAAIESIDNTIEKMLNTANTAILDGKLIVDTLKSHLEKFANEM